MQSSKTKVTSMLLPLMKEAPGSAGSELMRGTSWAGRPAAVLEVVEASLESLGDWMALVDVLNSQPDVEADDRVMLPLVVFFEARDA